MGGKLPLRCARRPRNLVVMKSYFLEEIIRPEALSDVLSELLPGQHHPWLLDAPSGDPIAYFHISDERGVQADLSGRHVGEDALVLSVLTKIKDRIGGTISGD